MNNFQRPLLIISFIFFIKADLLALAQVECINNGNYTSNSTYSSNLNATLSSLYTNVDNNGFYNVSVGEGTDRVNGLVLCRGDTQFNACRECIQTGSAELLTSCPNRKQAIRWSIPCMLRYSNETMIGAVANRPVRYWRNPRVNATNPDRFQEVVRTLLEDLRDRAASGGSLRKVAAGNMTGPDFQIIFALVQCTPDLSREQCNRCLIEAASEITIFCDRRRGCRVLWPSCNLRFENFPFFNETRLQEFELDSVPGADPPLQSSPGNENDNTRRGKDNNTTKVVISIVVPIGVCIIILAACALVFLRKRTKQRQQQHLSTDESGADVISKEESLHYDFGKIRAATNDFADANKLGQGGFGAVYQGRLLNGQDIAVKRLAKNSGQGDIEFKNEVLLLAKLQHRNLVRLLGFSIERRERALIYEFVQNASLDQFIFDPERWSYLDWDKRFRIILGIARGIMYLHEDSRLKIIHRDLKASNVLLDGDMNPKIADFGMARLFGQDETHRNTNRIVGTYGYMAPEYAMRGHFSVKSDVFSFGVLVLEIISGQKNNSTRNGENVEDLLTSTWKNWRQGTLINTIHPVLLRDGSGSMREMVRCIHMGLLCVQENATDRPTMTSIVLMLSSSTMTLAVPSEPAFYFSSDVAQFQQLDTEEFDSGNASNANAIISSDNPSRNDMSITELYPR